MNRTITISQDGADDITLSFDTEAETNEALWADVQAKLTEHSTWELACSPDGTSAMFYKPVTGAVFTT